MNEIDYNLCEQQQDFFEYAQTKLINMNMFIQEFMTSDFCNKELDAPYSWFQSVDILEWEEILHDVCTWTPDIFASTKMSKSVARWIGYIYRLIQQYTRLHSREILQKIPVQKLMLVYDGLHTLDDKMAMDILLHDFGLQQ